MHLGTGYFFFIQPVQETPVMGTDNQDYDYDIDD